MSQPTMDPHTIETEEEDATTKANAFGTFFVRGTEFGLRALNIREVVPYPGEVTPLPLTEAFVDGLFTLRGEVLPIVDLAGLLGLDPVEHGPERRVAIVEDGSACVGIALDRTGELLRTEDGALRSIDEKDENCSALVDGLICMDGGKRFIQTLSARAISLASGLPEAALGRPSDDTPPPVQSYSKAIVVEVGDIELAFAIDEVREISGGARVGESPRYFEHCIGVTKLRDCEFAVLDLREALGQPADPGSGRLLFVEQEGFAIGLVVDSLVETLEYPDDELHPVPDLLSDGIAALCRSLILPSPERHVLLVDVAQLFAQHEVMQVRDLLDSSDMWDDEVEVDDGEELGFFAFRVDRQILCVPLENVREVQETGEGVIRTGGANASNDAYLNLRGDLVPLIESRTLLDIDDEEGPERPLALVMEDGDTVYGLVVDAIVDIKRTRSSKVTECGPSFARHVNAATLGPLLERALVVDRGDDPDEVLLVLSAHEILKARSSQAYAAKARPVRKQAPEAAASEVNESETDDPAAGELEPSENGAHEEPRDEPSTDASTDDPFGMDTPEAN